MPYIIAIALAWVLAAVIAWALAWVQFAVLTYNKDYLVPVADAYSGQVRRPCILAMGREAVHADDLPILDEIEVDVRRDVTANEYDYRVAVFVGDGELQYRVGTWLHDDI